MRRLGPALAALVIIAVLLVGLLRGGIAMAALDIASLASGYSIHAADMRLGLHHGALVDLHVSRGGEPVLDAQRVDLDYSPRDLLPGSHHRFGITAISINSPHFTLIHHQNGSYNVSLPSGGPRGGVAGPPNSVPLDFTIRVRNASATLIDKYRFYASSRVQSVSQIDADVNVNDQARTWYRVTGILNDAGPQPFRLAGSIDKQSGFALHHISAKAIPIATISNYFINSRAAHVLGGTVRNMDLQMWSYGSGIHMSGTGQMADGAMIVHGLDSPIAHLSGPITLFDSGFASQRLTASVGHVHVVCSGGIFDFVNPQFRIGVDGGGDLSNLQEIMRIARGLPITGALKIHALIEGAIDNPVLLIGFNGKHWNYGAVPLEHPQGQVALLKDHLIVLPFHAGYGAMKMHVQGDLHLAKQVHSVLAVHAIGPSAAIPYLGALVPDQPIVLETLMTGDDLKVDARGYLASLTDANNVSAFFALDRFGEGQFGPMNLREPSGGTLLAGFALHRRAGNSAFWASVHDMRLREPAPIRLPGVSIPEMPPIDAQIGDANIAGAGSAQNVVIGGHVTMAPATIAGVPFDHVSAAFAGPFAASHLSSVDASGPWGHFTGGGTFGTAIIAARGNYNGTLDGLHMFLGGLPAHGAVSGPVGIAIAQGKIFVQVQNAQLANATIQGIPISQMSGTMSFANNVLRIYSARAAAAGGNVDVAGTFATGTSTHPTQLAIVTTPLQATALHSLGVPLSRGTMQAAGTLSPGAGIPNLNAGVVVAGGDLLGYAPFDMTSEVGIANASLQLRDGLASLGTTIAGVDGSIGGITRKAPTYDLRASVPAGDIAAAATMMHVPSYNAQGSFSGDLNIGGAGVQPAVSGTVSIPEASINGLGLREGTARINASTAGVDVRNARVTIGSSRAQFHASVHSSAIAFSMHTVRADLSDFNDYFNTGDTLAGTGALDLAFSHFNNLTFTSGNVDIDNFRFRRLPIGNTDARWSGVRNILTGSISVGGEHGLLSANGSIAFAPSRSIGGIVSGSRYNLHAALQNFDLATWLPALGYPQLPVTGRVNGTARLRGAFPHFDLAMDASAHDGTVGPFPVETAMVSAQSAGDRINVTQMVFALPSVEASGSGSFGLTPSAPMSLQVHAASNDLAAVIARMTKQRLPIAGQFETTVTVGGTLHAPSFSAGLAGTNVNLYGIAMPSFFGELALHQRSLLIRNARFNFARGSMTMAGNLPVQLQPFAFGSPASPIGMDLTAENLDLSTFQTFLGNNTRLGGTLNGHVGISGRMGSPLIYGQVAVNGVSYVSALETTPITNTSGQLGFGGNTATLTKLHAQLGRGVLDGSGSLNFGGALTGGPLAYGIAVTTRGAQLSSPLFGSASFDSRLRLTRKPGQLAVLSGTVAVNDAVIPLSSFLQFSGPAGGQAAGPPLNLGFDMAVTAGKNVRVRGGGAGIFGLDIGGSGNVHLAGTLQKPTLEGVFNSAGGTMTYIDHAFKVQQGKVTFTPQNGVLPDIYAIATTHVLNPDPNTARNPTGYADITAQVTGTVPDVKVSFTTNPPGYTEQQIIALLLPFNGLVGPIQFTESGGAILPEGQLPGAPAIPSGVLPNVFVQRQNGTVTIGQEAFNILNTQFASGILSPLESALGNTLGLSDVNLTVDYGGNVGLGLRRLLGGNVYAIYGTTFTVPQRQTFGVAYQPTAFTSAQFTMFVQQGATPLFLTPNQTLSNNARASLGQALQGQNGFTFLFQRLF